MNNKACCCNWGFTSDGGPRKLKCRLKRAQSDIQNNFTRLSQDKTKAIIDLLAMGHDRASADNVYAKYEKSSFKSEKRLWSGHHYSCNLDVTYVGDGTSPDVVVLPSESHPDMVRTAAAVHGPIPACPFDSAVDSLIASRRPRAADAPPPSIEGSDSRSGSRAAVFVGAQVPGTFAGEGSAMDISQAKFDECQGAMPMPRRRSTPATWVRRDRK